MPTFAQHPFSFEGVDVEMPEEFLILPPELRGKALGAIKMLYVQLIQAAENAGTAVFMEIQMDGGTPTEMTVDEIEAFQMGALLAITTTMERFVTNEVIDQQKFFKMLFAMMIADHKKQEGGA